MADKINSKVPYVITRGAGPVDPITRRPHIAPSHDQGAAFVVPRQAPFLRPEHLSPLTTILALSCIYSATAPSYALSTWHLRRPSVGLKQVGSRTMAPLVSFSPVPKGLPCRSVSHKSYKASAVPVYGSPVLLLGHASLQLSIVSNAQR